MGEDKASDTGYDLSDGEWLTYAELAARRGIDRQSAFKLAARHRWRRQKGNIGQVRVFVPSAFAEPEDKSSDARYDLSYHLAAFETALTTIKEAHAGEVAAIREAYAGEITVLRERLERAEAEASGQRVAAEAARGAVEQARAEAKEAQDAAEALRQAEAARKARGRWARLRAAWRGVAV